jgi:hypothetical protein
MHPATACTIWAARGMAIFSGYAREMIRTSVVDGAVAELAVYCTGDWDEARQREHARTVTLRRPLAGTP